MVSISWPLRPMTRPGRAVCSVTRTLFQARSMTTRAMAANWSFSFTYPRMARSLCRFSV